MDIANLVPRVSHLTAPGNEVETLRQPQFFSGYDPVNASFKGELQGRLNFFIQKLNMIQKVR